MCLQCSLRKKRMKHGLDCYLKVYNWVDISEDFVLEVRVKVLGFAAVLRCWSAI